MHIPGNTEEKRGFQYFLTNTAVELSGYYDKTFWQYLLLQVSNAEPPLRHAVIAIGALHEDFSKKRLKYSPENSGFAMKQYLKAIRHLRTSLATGTQAPLTALLSCILFVCFDSLRGQFTAAIVHLQSGLKILRDLRDRGTGDDEVIENVITPIFMRLSMQSILYIDTRKNYDRQAFAAELMQCRYNRDVPECFESLEEARNCMNQAADGLFRMLYTYDFELPCCLQPVETLEQYDKYSTQIRDWNIAFEKFIKAKSQDFDSKQVRGAALLKAHHLIINIMAKVSKPEIEDPRPMIEVINTPDRREPFTQDFRSVVSLCRSLITAGELDAQNGRSSLTFSTDMGMVAPLYYIAVQCQDMGIREEAMALLTRRPRREGMWDGEAMSRLIQEFWQIEKTHNSWQQAGGPQGIDATIPLNEALDLVMHDGMTWEWKWKDARAGAGRSRTATPEHVLTNRSIRAGSQEHTSALFELPDVSDAAGTFTNLC